MRRAIYDYQKGRAGVHRKRNVGGVSVQYRIKKEAVPDAEAVKLYIMCKEVF